MIEQSHPVILFDGVCNLCNASVQYVIQHDKKRLFHFASLQSPFGEIVLKKFGFSSKKLNSIILFENNKIYTRSTAALLIAKKLSGIIKLLYGFIFIPKFIRDAVYNLIANNRYKWFGKREACWVPTPELKNLFLDQ